MFQKNLEECKQTGVLVMDFAKAFNKVCHSLLLHKLDHYGIQGKTNRWIQAFLSGRNQVVATEGFMSDSVSVQSGVPQWAVLGPSLFLYYMNDIHEELESTVRLSGDVRKVQETGQIRWLMYCKSAICRWTV